MPDCNFKNRKIFIVGEPSESKKVHALMQQDGYRNLFTFRELSDAAEALSLLKAELIVTNANNQELRKDFLTKLSNKFHLVTDVPIVAVELEAIAQQPDITDLTADCGITIEFTNLEMATTAINLQLKSRTNLQSSSTLKCHLTKRKSNSSSMEKEKSLRAVFQRSC